MGGNGDFYFTFLIVVVIVTILREDITGLTDLNTVLSYKEAMEDHMEDEAVWEHGDLQQPVPPVAACLSKAQDKRLRGLNQGQSTGLN